MIKNKKKKQELSQTYLCTYDSQYCMKRVFINKRVAFTSRMLIILHVLFLLHHSSWSTITVYTLKNEALYFLSVCKLYMIVKT